LSGDGKIGVYENYIIVENIINRSNNFKPCSALAWTASQICFVISKMVSFDAPTSSPRMTLEQTILGIQRFTFEVMYHRNLLIK